MEIECKDGDEYELTYMAVWDSVTDRVTRLRGHSMTGFRFNRSAVSSVRSIVRDECGDMASGFILGFIY